LLIRGEALNDFLCLVGQKLRQAHLEATTTYLDYLSWRTEAPASSDADYQETLEALKRLRQAAVERLVDHLATCEKCASGNDKA
jgi:tRNA U34 5-methylaminomethyl-2-thiouridine-forming methyltransferase MnmC